MKHHYALNLKVLRLRLGLTQTDTAHLLGISQPRMSRIEAGIQEPTIKEMCSLCIIYDVPVTKLYGVTATSAVGAIGRRLKTISKPALLAADSKRRAYSLSALSQRLRAHGMNGHVA